MIEFGHLSHVGLRRDLNEDTYCANAELGVWLVADGMGGHEFGEVASALAREAFLVIADLAGAAGKANVQAAAPIDEAEILTLFGDSIQERVLLKIDPESGAMRARRLRAIGRMVLSETPTERPSGEALAGALLEVVREDGLALLHWTDEARQLRARVAFMRSLDGELWPDWSDAGLLSSLDQWLLPGLIGLNGLREANLVQALAAALPFELRRRLDVEAPLRFETPAGSSLAIEYDAEGGPALNVRLQELFGQDKHPHVASGRVALTLRLLSPAQRPVQTTKDLPGFWRGSYAAVRADMRGRYPKHPWPEDPLSASPTRRAKPRGS